MLPVVHTSSHRKDVSYLMSSDLVAIVKEPSSGEEISPLVVEPLLFGAVRRPNQTRDCIEIRISYVVRRSVATRSRRGGENFSEGEIEAAPDTRTVSPGLRATGRDQRQFVRGPHAT
jgi:hypothetical protein